MKDIEPFAWLVLLVALAGLAAVLSNHAAQWLKIPTPGIFFVAAAAAVHVIPNLNSPPNTAVQRLVTVALLVILFDGGMHIGWRRFNSAKGPITLLGLGGTFLTVVAVAVLGHVALGLGWYAAVLVATAVSPTDPAVVFSVLGNHEVAGRSGTILEGESGANDPVGIALMASLVGAGGITAVALLHAAGGFVVQMLVGGLVGVVGGRLLLWFTRRVPLPSEGLYPLRTLASAFVLYGAATLCHGSGFLAVFVAGIVIGDARAPYKVEVERFTSALASLAEIVAFTALGLTVDLKEITRLDVWVPGLVLAIALAVVVRPALIGLCLLPVRLRRNESVFVLFAGLKGAVPILLGTYLLTAGLPDADRLYGIVIVVVTFSVLVQGSLVPTVAHWLNIRMRMVEPEPWALGVRLGEEPQDVIRLTVRSGALADGRSVEDLTDLPDDIWVSLVVRDRRLVPVRGDTVLHAGDEVLVLAESGMHDMLTSMFERPS